ncbi:MAG: hypothetical protein CBD72_03200 [Flavobacteriaceae bacterium TMED212]|nr:MAG: hypothetical protein CBD72_03200 [Flavobacteriaceae bacterium TMED212]|tara:strand:- start:3596 stop:4552 length:957 start_codon:yes stop_codon:yes gene_type:complete
MQRNFEYLRLRFPRKNRLRFFSLFFALSSFFWIITKLSNSFSSSVNFEVKFVNVPNLVILDPNINVSIKADITASGFQLLIYHYFKKNIRVTLDNAHFSDNLVEIDLMDQKFVLQQQLYQSTKLNLISPSKLTIPFSALKRKKIPVIPPSQIDFKPGYDRAGDWIIEPDSIWVYGPSPKIDTLNKYVIHQLSIEKIDQEIVEKVDIISWDQIKFETNKILIKAPVKRFTEKSIEVFINIKNVPDSLAIKLFPQSLKVTFLVLLDRAEAINSGDFKFICDFEKSHLNTKNTMDIFLEMRPEGVRNVRWKPKEVDYLIRK